MDAREYRIRSKMHSVEHALTTIIHYAKKFRGEEIAEEIKDLVEENVLVPFELEIVGVRSKIK